MRKYCYDENLIREAVLSSTSYSEVLRKLKIPVQGNNTTTLKKYINKYNIPTNHFMGSAKIHEWNYIPAEEYLKGLRVIHATKLLKKLYKEGIKEKKCEICGIEEWQGKPITFQIHHIDGNHNNNSLNNLQVLCPNCHSQTENYCGSANKKVKHFCKICGRELKGNPKSGMCLYCSRIGRRKVDRPSKEVLQKEVNKIGYSATGRKYGVTDNTIRKWLR